MIVRKRAAGRENICWRSWNGFMQIIAVLFEGKRMPCGGRKCRLSQKNCLQSMKIRETV